MLNELQPSSHLQLSKLRLDTAVQVGTKTDGEWVSD